MKLRTKLKLAFLIMVILPVILCAFSITAIFNMQTANMYKLYEVDSDTIVDNIHSSAVIMGRMTESIYTEAKELSEQRPEIFQNQEFLEELDVQLDEKLSKLAVRKNGFIIYLSEGLNGKELMQFLPEYDEIENSSDEGTYIGGDYPCLIKQLDFKDSYNNKYSVSIITSLNQVIPQIKGLVMQGVIAIILVLIFTSLLLSLWVYGSIIRSVDKLKLATENIKQGNLDFEMPKIANDEIGEVCKDFEEMRMILKQSSEDKLNSDLEEKELIRNISHDLKTPLAAIKGYVEGLLDGVADTPQKREKYLKTIANKVNDMDKLINELTIYSKLDTNRVPYSFCKLNARQYFDDCCDEIGMELETEGISLDYKYHASDNVTIDADAEQLKRVINNIISNSVKYMDSSRKGHIDFDVFDEGKYMHVIIKDNGKGIGINELPHIFERFYRTDSSRNSAQGGSGIGLAIVKKIIEDHKGKIWAESVEGKGTTMHINLIKDREEMCYAYIEDKHKKDK